MHPVSVEPPAPSWLDRLVAWFNPEAGARRLAFRAAGAELESLSYRGARYTRVGQSVAPQGRADFELESTQSRRKAVDRARQLERDSVIAESLLARSVENVMGDGFGLEMLSSDPAWNKLVESEWKRWADEEADVRGLNTLDELDALTFRAYLRDGEAGTIKLGDLKLQSIESDQIASPLGSIPTKDEIDGIKLDRRGKPVSFTVVTRPDPQNASVRFGQETEEIAAKDVLFLARRQRHGQTRGVSALVGVSWILEQIDGQIEAVTIAARMAACLGLVIARKSRMAGLTTAEDSAGNQRRKLRLEPGLIHEVSQGDIVQQIDPKQPSTNFADFLDTLGRIAGLAFGLPLEVSMMNHTKSNYSQSRAALLQAQRVWRNHQGMMGRYKSQIFRWWLLRKIELGEIEYRADAMAHKWRCPGWRWVDPGKELEAGLGAVDAGICTRAELAKSQGRDLREVVAGLALEEKLFEEAGIEPAKSRMTRDRVEAAAELEGSPKPGDRDPNDDGQADDDEDDDEGDE